MTSEWAQRQRDTNHLVRLVGEHVFGGGKVTPEQLFGLCKLTWITKSYENAHSSYIWSTKIPALQKVFGTEYSGWSLQEVADDVGARMGTPAKNAVLSPTGFTNIRNTYRNTSE